MVGEELYKRSATSPMLKCIGPENSDYALREVHEGICRDHFAGKILALKILRQEYYWPTITKNAMEFMKKYHKCQIHNPIPRHP